MEHSLPSLLFVGQQIKEWVKLLSGEVKNVPPPPVEVVDMKLPDYNMAIYCLSAALAFTATIVFVLAWKRSDSSKKGGDDGLKGGDKEDTEYKKTANDFGWCKEGNDGAGEFVPWILQEGPPGDDPTPLLETDICLTDTSEEDIFHHQPHKYRKHKNKMNFSVPETELSLNDEIPWILQESNADLDDIDWSDGY